MLLGKVNEVWRLCFGLFIVKESKYQGRNALFFFVKKIKIVYFCILITCGWIETNSNRKGILTIY